MQAALKRSGFDTPQDGDALIAPLAYAGKKLAAMENRGMEAEPKLSFKGVDEETGRKIYRADFGEGLTKQQKRTKLAELIQNVWANKPITLPIEEDGETREIEARFNPDYDPTNERKTDAGKIVNGNKMGSVKERRITLGLSGDMYQIISDAEYLTSAAEQGKQTATHEGVKQWRYFATDILAEETDGDRAPYTVFIDVKETGAGNYVYTYYALNEEKSARLRSSSTTASSINTRANSSQKAAAASGGKIIVPENEQTVKTPKNSLKNQNITDQVGQDAALESQIYNVNEIEEAGFPNTLKGAHPQNANVRALASSKEDIAEKDEDVKRKYSFSLKTHDTTEESKELMAKAIEIFGTTNNWNETGYILPNGKKLDLSGKREGAAGGYRTEDHRAIQEAYGDDTEMSGTECMIDFMRRGAIRIMPESGGINLQTVPTKSQMMALDSFITRNRGEVVIDIDNENGVTLLSKGYNKGTYSGTILQELPDLIARSERSNSITAQFHDSYSLKNQNITDQVGQDAALASQLKNDENIRAAAELMQKFQRIDWQGESNLMEMNNGAEVTAKQNTSEKKVTAAVEKIIQETGTQMEADKIRKGVRRLYNGMNSRSANIGEALTYARSLARQVLEQSPGPRAAMDPVKEQAVQYIRNTRFYLTEDSFPAEKLVV